MSALAPKDVNMPVVADKAVDGKPEVKSMEYHRQMLQSKMAQEKYEPAAAATSAASEQPSSQHASLSPASRTAPHPASHLAQFHAHQGLTSNPAHRSSTYISPSDNIMSPCTAKLTALRNKNIGKVKPKSLFAQTSSKKLEGANIFGARNPSPPKGSDA